MLNQNAKDLFAKLNMEYQPIAVKFFYLKPEGVEREAEVLSFCQFLKKAQVENRKFYITKDNDNCCGKMTLGMVPKDSYEISGLIGKELGVFRNPSANIRLHNSYPVINLGTVRYVEFCPVAMCDFDPDLVICVAALEQADILMRATSYISGDLWESRTSHVVSCAWTYSYPFLTGKVNFCITGMHHGMRRRKVYPAGLHIISIPYQKLDEVVTALGEMEWVPLGFRDDDESRTALKAKLDGLAERAAREFEEN